MHDIPDKIKAAIKQKAESEWPGDFVMQLDMIESQSADFKIITKLKEQNAENPTFKTILKNALKEWPDDYTMQLDTIRSQLDAAVKLAEYSGLSGDSSFKKAKKKEPDMWSDEDMQVLFYRMDMMGFNNSQ